MDQVKRTIDYIPLPKTAKLEQDVLGNKRVVYKGKKGIWMSGYNLINAKSKKEAYRKLV